MRHSGFLAQAGGRIPAPFLSLLAFVLLADCGQLLQAQWLSQTNTLRAGWNAVFLHVDASYATLDQLVGRDGANPIQEIWYWQTSLATGQFVDSPQVPSATGSQWSTWTRLGGAETGLQRLAGNAAYLVKVAANTSSYQWVVKGKPVAPNYRWTLTGLNFVGFPTPSQTAPTFDSFLAPSPALQQQGEIYRYPGGELGPNNPARVLAFRTTPVRRDQAFWVRAGENYNSYFGPLQISQGNPAGIHFGDRRGQAQIRVRNLANVPIVLTLQQLASETPPAGQTPIQGLPPLLLRGPLNNTNLTFSYSSLSGSPKTWNLAAAGAPGSEVEVILGVNRSSLTAAPGALFAGVLRFTDSLGLSQLDLAVSAVKESTVGLWVGGAAVSSVGHYLKPYARATNEADLASLLTRLQLGQGVDGYRYERDPETGRVLVFGGPERKTGSYLLDGPVRTDAGEVASPFPLRLILHNDGSAARMLQKVYHGPGLGSNLVVTTHEGLLLPSKRAEARRISSIHLPTSDQNLPWICTGNMRPGGSLRTVIDLGFDDQASNPFLHTYHPDHDNLDPLFATAQSRGVESYGVKRQITLTFTPPLDDFNSLTQGSQELGGDYAETLTFEGRGAQTRQFNVLGTFTLKRLSDIATLTTD